MLKSLLMAGAVCAGLYPCAASARNESVQQRLSASLATWREHAQQLQAARKPGVPNDGAPTITGGAITTPALTVGTAPATPGVSFTYKAPGGLAGIGFFFVSPSTAQIAESFYYPPVPLSRSGTITIQSPSPSGELSLYAEAGDWTLETAAILDADGEENYYDNQELAGLFPSVIMAVSNANPADVTPPVVTGGKLLTPVVKLTGSHPYLEIDLSGTDDVSGVASALFDVTDPKGNFYTAYGTSPSAFLSGTELTALNFAQFQGVLPGAYSIVDYQICDVAGNCHYDSSPADIRALLGTTAFLVKQ